MLIIIYYLTSYFQVNDAQELKDLKMKNFQ